MTGSTGWRKQAGPTPPADPGDGCQLSVSIPQIGSCRIGERVLDPSVEGVFTAIAYDEGYLDEIVLRPALEGPGP